MDNVIYVACRDHGNTLNDTNEGIKSFCHPSIYAGEREFLRDVTECQGGLKRRFWITNLD